MISTLLQHIDTYRSMRVRQTSRHWQAHRQIPPGLYEYWKSTAHREFKGIPRDAFFFARAADGLFDFFECKRMEQAACGLPSRAADSVWHAWMRYSPGELEAFCRKHFGRAIAHVEAEALGEDMEPALARTLVHARTLESKPRASMHLPRLFTLDRTLRMPGGYGYRLAWGAVAWESLDQAGKPEGRLVCPAALTPLALLSAGLVTQTEYDDYIRSTRHDTGGDSGGGSSADCADGGSSCGSGSGCGGGCGGGCG